MVESSGGNCAARSRFRTPSPGTLASNFDSSPCLRPDLSLSTVGHYALSTVVFISQTICHALNQLNLVVKTLGHPVAVAMPNIMHNRLKPTPQCPGHSLQRFLSALTGAFNQLE